MIRTPRPRHLPWLLAPLAILALSCSVAGGLLPTPLPTLPVPINWRQRIVEFPTSPFAVADGVVVYLDVPSNLQAYDAKTGRHKWSYKLERGVGQLLRPVPITQGLLFVMDDAFEGPNAGDGWISAIDLQTGKEQWRLPVGDETDDRWYAEPAAADGVVFFESGFGEPVHNLNAADATGNLLWSVPVGGRLSKELLVEGGQIFGAVVDPVEPDTFYTTVRLFALDIATGDERWSVTPPDETPVWLASGDGRLYFGARLGPIYALDETNGATLWQVTPMEGWIEAMAFSNGGLYVADNKLNLASLDPATGQTLWNVTTDGFIRSTPIAAAGQMYFGDGNGVLHALDAATGAEQWRTQTLIKNSWPDMHYFPEMEYAPAIADGVLFYSDTQYLIAVQVP